MFRADVGFVVHVKKTYREYSSLGSSRYMPIQKSVKMSAVRKYTSALLVASLATARSTMEATALKVPPMAWPDMLNLKFPQRTFYWSAKFKKKNHVKTSKKQIQSIQFNNTWYECLRYPHGKVATDTKHAAREDVRRPADQRNTGQCSSKELHPTCRHVHFHQHCGHHKHQQD